MPDRIKVLYVLGRGRSGSTLLDMLLGQIDGFTGVGEIYDIWRLGPDSDVLCACGKPYSACDFWNSVIDEAYGGRQFVDLQYMRHLWLSLRSSRNIVQLISGRYTPRFRKDFAVYGDYTGRLYRAIHTVSNCRVVVDSSKRPLYALMLNALPDIDLYILHLVRDSRAVAYSTQRRKRRVDIQSQEKYMVQQSVAKSALLWSATNLLAETLRISGAPRLFVRYEDFVQYPMQHLMRIMQFVGEPPPPTTFLDTLHDRYSPVHNFLGNPMRVEGKLEIRPDFAWQKNMSVWQQLVTTGITAPLLIRYGYLPKRNEPYAHMAASRREEMP